MKLQTMMITALTLCGITACTDGKDTGELSDDWNAGEVFICDIEKEDPFTITSVAIEDDKIVVGVSYSGGCAAHDWQVCWDGDVAESAPVQVWLDIGHNANGDSCEMEKTESLSIGLGALEGVETPMTIHIGGQTITYGE